MIDLLSRIPNAQKATSYDEGRINAQEGREQRQVCGQKLRFRPTTTMISPLPSKVNNPPHLADFAAGSAYLHSKFGHRKLDAILNFFHK
jgi:hypothetical protein